MLSNPGSMADRRIYLQKEYDNIRLTIFEGEHEILSTYALNKLLKN
jgi:hypothetical protein